MTTEQIQCLAHHLLDLVDEVMVLTPDDEERLSEALEEIETLCMDFQRGVG